MPANRPFWIIQSYALSLGWVAILFSLGMAAQLISDLIAVDFVYGNPNRTRWNAVTMMFLFPPIFAVIASIGVVLTFTFSQIFQAVLDGLASRFAERWSFLVVLAALPVTAVITWFCWDYFTPSNLNLGINEGPDWKPYEHGISLSRYIGALQFQVPETLFCLCFRHASIFCWATKYTLLGWIILATVWGVFSGVSRATP